MGALAGVNGAGVYGSPRSLAQRGRAAWASAEVYIVVFAAALLSALSGFMMGSTMGVHSQLGTPGVAELGEYFRHACAGANVCSLTPPDVHALRLSV